MDDTTLQDEAKFLLILEILGTTPDEENCANARTAISEICDNEFDGRWEILILDILSNMTQE